MLKANHAKSEEFQRPQPLPVSEKVLQYTSTLYGSTPPIRITVPSWKLSLEERETQQYISHLYCNTPPICTAAAVLGGSAGGWGHRKVPDETRSCIAQMRREQQFVGPAPLQKCVGDFCCAKLGGFCRGFSWRIFLGTFPHKNEEKNPATKSMTKSGGSKIKIRAKSVLPKTEPKICCAVRNANAKITLHQTLPEAERLMDV